MTADKHFLQCVFIVAAGFEDLSQNFVANALIDSALSLGVEGNILLNVYHTVGKDLDFLVLNTDAGNGYTGIVHFLCQCTGDDNTFICHHFTGHGVHNRTGKLMSGQSAGQIQLLIVLIATNSGQIISSGIEEQTVQVGLCALKGRRLTRTKLSVNLEQTLFHSMGGILLDGSQNALIFTEICFDLLICAETEGADKCGDRDLSVFINADIQNIVYVIFVLEPCAAVRNDRGRKELLACLVVLHLVVHAGRTNELGNDDALCAVDDEGAGRCHQGEIAHEDFGFLDLTCFLVEQACGYAESSRVRSVAFLALCNRIIGFFVELVVHEVQNQISVEIRNTGHIVEYLAQTLFQEPIVGILLDLDQIGHLENFIDV